jgi:multisubunit Na+/H+ antiporter MnhB subunit
MRRVAEILAMAVVLFGAHLVNAWFIDAQRQASAHFESAGLAPAYAVLPLATAAAALVLGWLVLRSRRPDALVAAVYLAVGLAVVATIPVWLQGGWAPPGWLPIASLLSGLELVLWAGAAIAVIGFAEALRWVGARLRTPRGAPASTTSVAPPASPEAVR